MHGEGSGPVVKRRLYRTGASESISLTSGRARASPASGRRRATTAPARSRQSPRPRRARRRGLDRRVHGHASTSPGQHHQPSLLHHVPAAGDADRHDRHAGLDREQERSALEPPDRAVHAARALGKHDERVRARRRAAPSSSRRRRPASTDRRADVRSAAGASRETESGRATPSRRCAAGSGSDAKTIGMS